MGRSGSYKRWWHCLDAMMITGTEDARRFEVKEGLNQGSVLSLAGEFASVCTVYIIYYVGA